VTHQQAGNCRHFLEGAFIKQFKSAHNDLGNYNTLESEFYLFSKISNISLDFTYIYTPVRSAKAKLHSSITKVENRTNYIHSHNTAIDKHIDIFTIIYNVIIAVWQSSTKTAS